MKYGRSPMTVAYGAVAETTGLKPKEVKDAVEGIFALAASQMKKAGSFNLADMLIVKLQKKPVRWARIGYNPFGGSRHVVRAKPASTTVKAIPLKKLKEMVN